MLVIGKRIGHCTALYDSGNLFVRVERFFLRSPAWYSFGLYSSTSSGSDCSLIRCEVHCADVVRCHFADIFAFIGYPVLRRYISHYTMFYYATSNANMLSSIIYHRIPLLRSLANYKAISTSMTTLRPTCVIAREIRPDFFMRLAVGKLQSKISAIPNKLLFVTNVLRCAIYCAV